MPSRTKNPAATRTMVMILGGFLLVGGLSSQSGRWTAQTSTPSCSEICASVPAAEKALCEEACRAIMQSGGDIGGATAGGGSGPAPGGLPLDLFTPQPTAGGASSAQAPKTSSFPPQQPNIPGSPSVAGTCLQSTYRTGLASMCIRAGRCKEAVLIRRGFTPDPTCTAAIDMTHIYGTERRHGAAPSEVQPEPINLGEIARQATAIVEGILQQLPASHPAASSLHDLRSYLGILITNAGSRQLTQVEIEATAQYLRSRILDVEEALAAGGMSISGNRSAVLEARRSAEEDLRTMLYEVFPRYLQSVQSLLVPGLDVTTARALHTRAAQQMQTAKESCAYNRESAACAADLTAVVASLRQIERTLRPPLEEGGYFERLESDFALSKYRGTVPSDGVPPPFIEGGR